MLAAVRAMSVRGGAIPLGLRKLAQETVFPESGDPLPQQQPAAAAVQAGGPLAIPPLPASPDVVQPKDQGGKSDNRGRHGEQVARPVETAHDSLDRCLHALGGHRGVRLEEREVAVVVLQADAIRGVNPVCPL